MTIFIIVNDITMPSSLKKAYLKRKDMHWSSGNAITTERLKDICGNHNKYIALFVLENGSTTYIAENTKEKVIDYILLSYKKYELIDINNKALSLFL